MKCAKCKQYFDLLCANFNEDAFSTMSTEFKMSWICIECLSKIPKQGNLNTPVRQQLGHENTSASHCLDVSMHTPENNITFRRPGLAASTQDADVSSTMTSMLHEIKEMQEELELRLVAKIRILFSEQFNNFNLSISKKIFDLTTKVENLDKKIQALDKSNNMPQGNAPETSEVTKPPKPSPQPKKKRGGVKPNPPLSSNSSSSSLPPLSVPVPAPAQVLTQTAAPTSVCQIEPVPVTDSPTLIRNVTVASAPGSGDDSERMGIEGGWRVVGGRGKRSSAPGTLRGTAAPGTTTLRASERWRYLHLYYVEEGTTVDQVRTHLNSICGNNDCTVEVLKSRGRYASFKLGVPSRTAERVMAPNNWAEDICVKPWRQNFRAKEKNSQEQST